MKRFFIIFLTICACTPSKEEKLFAKSVETHELALNIGSNVARRIKKIEAHADIIEDSLKFSLLDSISSLKNDLEAWEVTIVEVPGYEHDEHDHHHDRDHGHEPELDLTPEMVLDIQRDIRDRAVKLNIRSQNILKSIEKIAQDEPVKQKEKASGHGT